MDDLRTASTSFSLLEASRLPSSPELTATQMRVDGLVSSFFDQATNPYSLTALVVGGMAYRTARIGVTSSRPLSVAVGLGAEVSAFELTQRGLRVGLGGESSSLLDWNGSNGLRKGLIHSLLSFGALRGTASLTQGQNPFLQNLLQDSAMVLSHNLAGAMGVGPRPSGSLTEQFLEAQALGLQMQAGASLIHGVAPSLSSLERGLDLSVSARSQRLSLSLIFGEDSLIPVLSPAGKLPPQIRPHEPERSEQMLMSISDFFPWRTKGRSPSPSSQEPIGVFESFYDPSESFPLRVIPEGQEVTLGREFSNQSGVFPSFFRNISRRHFDLRILEGRIEIRAHHGSRGIRINEIPLVLSQWYVLRHGDQIEFVSEARREDTTPALHFFKRGMEDTNRPAVFRFLRQGEARPPDGAISQSPPEMAPETIQSSLLELHRLRESLTGVLNLYSGGLREVREHLERNPHLSPENFTLPAVILSVGDIVNAHRRLCGNPERSLEITLQEETPEAAQALTIRVPDFRGLLLEKLNSFQEAARQHEARQGSDPVSQRAREDLAAVRDSLDRMYQTLKILGRFFRRPQERIFMSAVEGAYEGLSLESVARTERVRSETRNLDLTLRQAEREAWIQDFLQRTFDPRVVRNVHLLTGKVSVVRGRPVGGNFYRALTQGTIYEGFRTVRALVDPESGEFIAFKDESPQFTEAFEALVREGRRPEEISLLVDATGSGRIEHVVVTGNRLRFSVREALQRLVGLQVLPEALGASRRSASAVVSSVFGVTEYWNPDSGEIWRISFPSPPDTPRAEVRRVVALTPLQDSAGEDGVPFWTLVTLEPTAEEPGVSHLQIWARTSEVGGLQEGSQVRVFQMK